MAKEKKFDKAFGYALRLLKIRQRSEKELKDKFRLKKFPQEISDEVIKRLKQEGLVNDASFAQAWVNTKMLLRPSGPIRLRYELRQKGITPQIIEDVLEGLKEKYDLEKEALELVKRKLASSKVKDKLKVRRRLHDYLKRRGFSSEVIFSCLQEIFKDFESE